MGMHEEVLDIYDESGAHVGVAKRSEVHCLGHWHQTFHCWIYRVREGKIQLLFQRRHPEKDTFPNLLDITAAGHLAASEMPEDGVRELKEELGLTVAFEALEPIGVIKDVGTAPGIVDKELCHVFAYPCEQPLGDYDLQPEEVTGLLWVDLDELERLYAGKQDRLEAAGFLSEPDGTRRDVTLQVERGAFVPHETHYSEQVFTAIRKLGNALMSEI